MEVFLLQTKPNLLIFLPHNEVYYSPDIRGKSSLQIRVGRWRFPLEEYFICHREKSVNQSHFLSLSCVVPGFYILNYL